MSNSNIHNWVGPFNPKTIGVIGGNGRMGKMVANFCRDLGYEVLTSDYAPERGLQGKTLQKVNCKLLQYSDVVILAVPINVLQAGWTQIIGHRKLVGLRDKLIIDLGSTKGAPEQALSGDNKLLYIGCHPMFGPKAEIAGQNVVLCPRWHQSNSVLNQRTQIRLDWLTQLWERVGAKVHLLSAQEHDRLAAIQQVAVLLPVLLHAVTVSGEGNRAKLNDLSTPNSRVMAERAKHMLKPEVEHLNVYAQIMSSNPYSHDIIDTFIDSLTAIKKTMLSPDSVHNLTELLMQTSLKYG